MKKPKTKTTKSLMDTMRELGQKSGVKVTDMSGRGIRAIGFIGGVTQKLKDHRSGMQKIGVCSRHGENAGARMDCRSRMVYATDHNS
jgi:hypothetical protein